MPTGAITHADALPATAELVIIGGGVIGAATADAARRAGIEPLVLEARPMLASATTSVATGAYRLQHDDPDELVLVRETVAAMRDFASYTGQTRYDPACVANGRVVLDDDGGGRRRPARDGGAPPRRSASTASRCWTATRRVAASRG